MFFNEEHKDQKGYKGGSDKNLSDINEYIKPLLKEIGFNCTKDKDDNTSNKQRIYSINEHNPLNYILAQVIIIENLHSIDTRANSNISEDIVNSTTEENRVERQLQILKEHNVFLFLYIKTGGWYVLTPYTSIPVDCYQLTYRGRPDRKNRMWIHTDFLPKFKKVSRLQTDLNQLLNC